MAMRYGGRHSPQGDKPVNAFRNRRVAPSDIRASLLFFAPLPLLFSGLGELRSGDASGMVGELGSLVVLLLAAWLLREGLKAEDEYKSRKVARPPAIPRKMFASVLTGIGVFGAAWLGWEQAFSSSIGFGVVAFSTHIFTFGLDPLRKKGMADFSTFDTDRAAKTIEKAEVTLQEIHDAASRFKDRELEGRVDRLGASVREVFRAVEEDPRDLTRARKFLGVYLNGARDATVKYADLTERNGSSEARADYVALIDDLETSFNNQRAALMLDDRDDLDIEIEVLRERLQQEGFKAH